MRSAARPWLRVVTLSMQASASIVFEIACSQPSSGVPDVLETPTAAVISATLAPGTSNNPESSSLSLQTITTEFDGEEAMRHVKAQMTFGPRPTGSEASRLTAAYIETSLRENGWATETQSFDYKGVNARNVIGVAGEGDRLLVLGAHYDTRRRADQDPQAPLSPVPGANDGASGVAVLLELSRTLDVDKVGAQVWLVFFDAEDNGQLDGWDWIAGSRYFVANLESTPDYAIIVDMVGDSDQAIYMDGSSDAALRNHLWEVAGGIGYADYFVPRIRYSMLDDHTPFNQRGIPAVDIIDFHYEYWHTTQDTVDKVSPSSLHRVGVLLETFLEAGGQYPSRK